MAVTTTDSTIIQQLIFLQLFSAVNKLSPLTLFHNQICAYQSIECILASKVLILPDAVLHFGSNPVSAIVLFPMRLILQENLTLYCLPIQSCGTSFEFLDFWQQNVHPYFLEMLHRHFRSKYARDCDIRIQCGRSVRNLNQCHPLYNQSVNCHHCRNHWHPSARLLLCYGFRNRAAVSRMIFQ